MEDLKYTIEEVIDVAWSSGIESQDLIEALIKKENALDCDKLIRLLEDKKK